jgi:hypothetical protein
VQRAIGYAAAGVVSEEVLVHDQETFWVMEREAL